MKDLRDLVEGSIKRIISHANGDFPSYAHEVAWMLCEYFEEPYGFWVRNVQYAKLNPGQIKYEFEQLQGKGFTRRQKAKMLMSTMDVTVK